MGNCLNFSRRNNRISSSFHVNGRSSMYGIPEHPNYPAPRPSVRPNVRPNVRQAWTESRNQEYVIRKLDNDKIIRFPEQYGSECCICLENSPNVYLNCSHHNFCYNCISKLVEFNYAMNKVPKCPICREIITSVNLGYILEFKTGFVI